MLRAQTRQMLGFGRAPTRYEIQRAQGVDALMQTGLSKAEALKIVDAQMKRAS
jgi:hypothetical protein